MIERLIEKRKVIAAAVTLSVGTTSLAGCADGVNNTKRVVTVCDKDVVRVGSGDYESNEFRVYAADEEGRTHVYRMVSTLVVGGTRFDTAEEYAKLNENRTYEIESSGYRSGVFGSFPNIIGIERVDPDHPEWC